MCMRGINEGTPLKLFFNGITVIVTWYVRAFFARWGVFRPDNTTMMMMMMRGRSRALFSKAAAVDGITRTEEENNEWGLRTETIKTGREHLLLPPYCYAFFVLLRRRTRPGNNHERAGSGAIFETFKLRRTRCHTRDRRRGPYGT